MPADRAAELELVAGLQLVDEVRRHLAVVDAVDGDRDARAVGGGGDGVAPLDLIAVLGRQPHVNVLARLMTRPVGNVQHEAPNLGGLVDSINEVGDLPGQSPA